MTIQVNFQELDLEVKGDYQKEVPRTHEYPGDPEYFEIEDIIICGNSIIEITSADFDRRLEKYINNDLQSFINEQ